jgi:UDP-3-O-[3-hydroxymyristoyl] glucosamine N-acyltransferase
MPVLLDLDRAPRLSELLKSIPAGLVQGVFAGDQKDSDPQIAGIGSLSSAGETEISFIVHSKYLEQLYLTQAAVVIVLPEINEALASALPETDGLAELANRFVRVVSPHPYLLYARLAQWFDSARQPRFVPGIHPTACIDVSAQVSTSALIGPHVVIGARSVIGALVHVGAGVVVGSDAVIGASSVIHPRVSVYDGVKIGSRAIVHSGAVLGADGFGFAPDSTLGKGAWGKIPQLGGLLIGDDVEIGANTTIDRGALENTIIEDGVKLDNQIMIAHNCRVGAHTAMAACVGVAGSTTIGQRCTIGGASMLSGHLILGDDVHISGGTAVTANVLKPGRYTGVFPFAEHAEWQKNAAVIGQLSQLRKRLRILERDD